MDNEWILYIYLMINITNIKQPFEKHLFLSDRTIEPDITWRKLRGSVPKGVGRRD